MLHYYFLFFFAVRDCWMCLLKPWQHLRCSDFLLVSDAPTPPFIQFNSQLQPNQTQKALTAGSAIILSCSGSGPVQWTTTAFNLMYHGKLGNPLEIKKSDPRHTGTYTCGYANQSLSHLNVWMHLYVNGRTNGDPSSPSHDEQWFSFWSGTTMLAFS